MSMIGTAERNPTIVHIIFETTPLPHFNVVFPAQHCLIRTLNVKILTPNEIVDVLEAQYAPTKICWRFNIEIWGKGGLI